MIYKVSYKTTLPLVKKSPTAYFISDNDDVLNIEFIDGNSNEIIESKNVKSGEFVYGGRQWFTNWIVNFKDLNGNILYQDKFNPSNKPVFIKIDAFALGDNIAWMPYIEEFRVKHKCNIICSTFWNNLFENVYTDILFVPPNTPISNVYVQYYIGTKDEINLCYTPTNHLEKPLQKVATDILGLEFQEIKPKIQLPRKIKTDKPYVCISEKASTHIKEWNGDWQKVVDYLNSIGYKVLVISKEPTTLKNIIDKTGNIPIEERVKDLVSCDFFIGVSSGLSWLAWASNIHTFLISDFTPSNHEFKSNCTRIYSENCVKKITNEVNKKSKIKAYDVILEIKKYLNK